MGIDLAMEDHHHCATATENLKQDHRVIEKVLSVLERLTAKPRGGSLETWRKAIDFIRSFADRCHHLKEEKIYFFPHWRKKGFLVREVPLA